MARKKTITDEDLIKMVDLFRLDHVTAKITIPKLGEYIRSKDVAVQDYTLRRNASLRDYIRNVNDAMEKATYSDVVVFSPIDIDAFLSNNNTKDKLKSALMTRDQYYANVAASAASAIKHAKDIESQLVELTSEYEAMKQKLATKQDKDFRAALKEKDSMIAKLKELLETYIYPDAANALLEKEEKFLVKSNHLIPDEKLDAVTICAGNEDKQSEYETINHLMDSFKE